jgi:hypothetical protein
VSRADWASTVFINASQAHAPMHVQALALFPQTASLNPKDLEPSFHDLRDEKGRRVEVLYANKGL